MTIRLGPFELHEPVGQGGMARVWRGAHREQEVAVAVKVMTAKKAHLPAFRRAFADEVRAVARLQHPGIVRVFDCGVVDETTALASRGDFVAGTPFLAMELGSGTLADIDAGEISFLQQRIILLRLLDALAYAHARGVIHRDLKPKNVLVVPDGDGPRLKIADFGLAHALDDEERGAHSQGGISGTPRFIAPEQITAEWRNQGPWTDLYALGCIAYWLASGTPPFSKGSTKATLKSHLVDPVPALDASREIPEGYERWLLKLLEKDCRRRFQHAADAAYALRKLTKGLEQAPVSPMTFSSSQSEDSLTQQMTDLVDDTIVVPELRGATAVDESTGEADQLLPPVPESWRYAEKERLSTQVIGAGLGLFGLRQAPMVDRDQERDLLWQSLLEVHQWRVGRAVVLLGEAGCGKSRLVQWICERAVEVGAATVFKANHGPMIGPTDSLSRMLSKHLSCAGLPRKEILDRVRTAYSQAGPLDAEDLFDCLALTEIIATTAAPDEDAPGRISFANPTERFAVIARLLRRIAHVEKRPFVVWLDDVQWGSDAVRFAHYLLTSPEATEVLFFIAARREELAARREEADDLEQLKALPQTTVLELQALRDLDHLEMVRGLLSLDESLAREVARRTAGNPLLAVQMVSDWVERNALQSTSTGYKLRPEQVRATGEDIHHVLVRRVQLLLSGGLEQKPEEALRALELAAALGRVVDDREWSLLCSLEGVDAPTDALEAMITAGLLRRSEKGWVFVHDVLRASLEQLARERARLTDHHRRVVQMLTLRYDPQRPGVSLRLARHMLLAAMKEEALEPLLVAATQARNACEVRRTQELLDKREQILDELGADENDERRIAGRICRASTKNDAGDINWALEELVGLVELARKQNNQKLTSDALYSLISVHRDLGDVKEAARCGEAARKGYEEIGDLTGVAKTTHNLGTLAQLVGEFDVARQNYEEALTLFSDRQDLRGMALCNHGLATLLTREGNLSTALQYLEKAFAQYEEVGDRLGMSNGANSFGEVYRAQKDFARAEQYYRRAVQIRDRLGASAFFTPRFNLVLSLIQQGEFRAAKDELDELFQVFASTSQKVVLGIIHTGLLACVAATKDWAAFDEHFERATAILEETGMVDKDLALLLELAAKKAFEADQIERGEKAEKAAAAQRA